MAMRPMTIFWWEQETTMLSYGDLRFQCRGESVLRVANSKTTNRTRLMGFFIVDGDCLRRLVRIILAMREVGKCDKDFS